MHSSGVVKKSPHATSGMQTFYALQSAEDTYPFVVAGRYIAGESTSTKQKVILWGRAPRDPERLRQATGELARTVDAYNLTFGAQPGHLKAFWIWNARNWRDVSRAFARTSLAFLDPLANTKSAELVSSDAVTVISPPAR